MPKNAYTDLEREVIVLKAVTDLIDDMVNYEIFEPIRSMRDMNLNFRSMTHKRLFNVLLVDLLSKPMNDDFGLAAIPENAQGSTGTFLYYLYQPAVIKTHRDRVRLFLGRKGAASDA